MPRSLAWRTGEGAEVGAGEEEETQTELPPAPTID